VVRISVKDKAALDVFAARERRKLADAFGLILQDRFMAEGCYPDASARKKPAQHR
jgi:hypothetical protein